MGAKRKKTAVSDGGDGGGGGRWCCGSGKLPISDTCTHTEVPSHRKRDRKLCFMSGLTVSWTRTSHSRGKEEKSKNVEGEGRGTGKKQRWGRTKFSDCWQLNHGSRAMVSAYADADAMQVPSPVHTSGREKCAYATGGIARGKSWM